MQTIHFARSFRGGERQRRQNDTTHKCDVGWRGPKTQPHETRAHSQFTFTRRKKNAIDILYICLV